MLEDRDYMRQPDYGQRRISATAAILIANAVVFVLQLITQRSPVLGQFQDQYLALSLTGIKSGYVWELLSFQFMHASVLHILFNSLAIYFFGRPVEMAIGARKFLALYFSSGIIGGLVQVLFALITQTDGPVVGASAGGAGLIGAFAILHWEESFTIFLYFLPINMRGKTLFWGSLALFLISMAIPSEVANAAHLGGLLTGAVFARQIIRGGLSLPSFSNPPPEYASTRPRKKLWGSAPPEEDQSADDFLKSEVDPILDKISAQGIQSLTAREREILEKARSKMTRR
jgi:membrane associated rhomboid family serine protease